jgi:hypothetical protein
MVSLGGQRVTGKPGRACRIPHDLLKFILRAADHLVLIVVVLERVTRGPVQDSLIKLTELRFWDIDVLGGPVRVALYMPGAEDPLGEGFDVHRAIRAPGMSTGLSGSLTATTYSSGWHDRYSAGVGPPKWRSM